MGAFPNPGLPTPGSSGGVPQWFTKPGSQQSWFPGAPQFNIGLSDLLSSYGQFDPELNDLITGMSKYGGAQQRQILNQGKAATAQAKDQLASRYAGGKAADRLASQGLESGGEGDMSSYLAKVMGTNTINAQAQGQAAQVPGKIAQAQQQVENQYRQNQIQGLKNMMDLITGAGQAQYGYQSAQLSADRGQEALAQAQNQEAQSNFGSVMSLLFGNQMPSLFGGGQNSMFGSGSMFGSFGGGGGWGSGGLSSIMGMFGGSGGATGAAIDNLADPLVLAA